MMNRKLIPSVLLSVLLAMSFASAHAGDDVSTGNNTNTSSKSAKKKVYKESEFAMLVRNKNKRQIAELLGNPVSKAQGSSKPSGADQATMAMGRLDSTRRDNVEIWYYKNLVSYDPKHTYSKVELTFLNDRCQNVAFFNTK